MFRTILVAFDGSPNASQALAVAVDLARHYKAKLCLLHAFPHVSDLLGTPQYEHLLAARSLIGEQVLDSARHQVPNDVPVASDPKESNPDAPTYASFQGVATLDNNGYADPSRMGRRVGTTIDKGGSLGYRQDLADAHPETTITYYEQSTGHNLVNGTVEGDVLAAGQGIIINGQVGDDVRTLGQAILLGPRARVGGDLAVLGMSLENQSGSVVNGDLLAGAYQALLAGSISKNVQGGLSRLDLRGTIGGNVDVSVNGDEGAFSAVQLSPAAQTPLPSVRPNLTLADSARIGGKLIYRSSAEAALSPAAQVAGGITYNRVAVQTSAPSPRIPGLYYLQRLAGLLLVGLLLLWVLPAWTRRLADTVQARPLATIRAYDQCLPYAARRLRWRQLLPDLGHARHERTDQGGVPHHKQ